MKKRIGYFLCLILVSGTLFYGLNQLKNEREKEAIKKIIQDL